MDEIEDLLRLISQSQNVQALESHLADLLQQIEIIPIEHYDALIPSCFGTLVPFLKNQRDLSLFTKTKLQIFKIFNSFILHDALKSYIPDCIHIIFTEFKEILDRSDVHGIEFELQYSMLRLIMECIKFFKNFMEPYLTEFMQLLQKVYEQISNSHQVANSIKKDYNPKEWFKVGIDCVSIFSLLVHIHRKWMTENLSKYLGIFIETLKASFTMDSLKERKYFKEYYTFISKNFTAIVNIARFHPLMIKEESGIIPTIFVKLLKSHISELITIKKELLGALKLLITTEFKSLFLPFIPQLLEESILIGEGLNMSKTLKSISYTTIAELIHHLKSDIDVETFEKIINVYSRILHDESYPLSMQTISCRLLSALADCINHEKATPDKKRLLVWSILNAFSFKVFQLKNQIQELKTTIMNKDSVDLSLDRMSLNMKRGALKGRQASPYDIAKEIKSLLKIIVNGIKMILTGMKNTMGSQSPLNVHFYVKNLNQVESKIFHDIFINILACFHVYSYIFNPETSGSSILASNNHNAYFQIASGEDKDTMDQFSFLFTLINPFLAQDIMAASLPTLIHHLLDYPILLTIPQYLLSNPDTTRFVSNLLMQYLMEHITDIGETSTFSLRTPILLRLFKHVFSAVSSFPDMNESMLQFFLSDLITGCLKYAAISQEPIHYYYLLRNLFRSIGGGRFELLYKEVLPLLPFLLENLNDLLNNTLQTQYVELFVELSLTIPVRLSVLLPYLSFLMKPLVISLSLTNELIHQGLRTLELCLDNLNHDFIDPVLLPHMNELLKALWNHCKPLPYPISISHTAIRILGKLSGRNRKLLSFSSSLHSIECCRDKKPNTSILNLTIDWKLFEDSNLMLKSDLPLEQILSKLETVWMETSKASLWLKVQCFHLIKVLLIRILKLKQEHFQIIRILLPTCSFDIDMTLDLEYLPSLKETDKYDEAFIQQESIEKCIRLLFIISASKSKEKFEFLSESAYGLLIILYEYYVYLNILCNEGVDQNESSSQNIVDSNEILLHFKYVYNTNSRNITQYGIEFPLNQSPEHSPLIRVLLSSLIEENEQVRQISLQILKKLMDDCKKHSDKVKMGNLYLFAYIMSKLISFCYLSCSCTKYGLVNALQLLISEYDIEFSKIWWHFFEIKLLRGLLFVCKDSVALSLYTKNGHVAKELIFKLLKLSYKDSVIETSNKTQIVNILISELTYSSKLVREIIQKSLELVANLENQSISEVIAPFKERFLLPIFTRPLRALPFSIQIGHVDALTYSLSLCPPLFPEITEDIIKILNETIGILDTDDANISTGKILSKNGDSIAILRVVCIELLNSAMNMPDFMNSAKYAGLRNKIIGLFFKNLYAKSPEIIAVSKKALQNVIQIQHKLPKDLLQHGLKPILMNLSDYKRLTVSGVEGLGRLLELLTTYFKLEIGKKLFDHLKAGIGTLTHHYSAVHAQVNIKVDPLMNLTESNIIMAILEIYHLLPGAAHVFLPDTLNSIIELEKASLKVWKSPYRKCIVKYVVKYSKEFALYCLQKEQLSNYHHLIFCEDLLNIDKTCTLKAQLFLELPVQFTSWFHFDYDTAKATEEIPADEKRSIVVLLLDIWSFLLTSIESRTVNWYYKDDSLKNAHLSLLILLDKYILQESDFIKKLLTLSNGSNVFSFTRNPLKHLLDIWRFYYDDYNVIFKDDTSDSARCTEKVDDQLDYLWKVITHLKFKDAFSFDSYNGVKNWVFNSFSGLPDHEICHIITFFLKKVNRSKNNDTIHSSLIELVISPLWESSGSESIQLSLFNLVDELVLNGNHFKEVTENIIIEWVHVILSMLSSSLMMPQHIKEGIKNFTLSAWNQISDLIGKQYIHLLAVNVLIVFKDSFLVKEKEDLICKVLRGCLENVSAESRATVRKVLDVLAEVLSPTLSQITWDQVFYAFLSSEQYSMSNYHSCMNFWFVVSKYYTQLQLFRFSSTLIPYFYCFIHRLPWQSFQNNPEYKTIIIEMLTHFNLSELESYRVVEWVCPNYIWFSFLNFIVKFIVMLLSNLYIFNAKLICHQQLQIMQQNESNGLLVKSCRIYEVYLTHLKGLKEHNTDKFPFGFFEKIFSSSTSVCSATHLSQSGDTVISELVRIPDDQLAGILIGLELLLKYMSPLTINNLPIIQYTIKQVPSLFDKLYLSGNPFILNYFRPLISLLYESNIDLPKSLTYNFIEDCIKGKNHFPSMLFTLSIFIHGHCQSPDVMESTAAKVCKLLIGLVKEYKEWIAHESHTLSQAPYNLYSNPPSSQAPSIPLNSSGNVSGHMYPEQPMIHDTAHRTAIQPSTLPFPPSSSILCNAYCTTFAQGVYLLPQFISFFIGLLNLSFTKLSHYQSDCKTLLLSIFNEILVISSDAKSINPYSELLIQFVIEKIKDWILPTEGDSNRSLPTLLMKEKMALVKGITNFYYSYLVITKRVSIINTANAVDDSICNIQIFSGLEWISNKEISSSVLEFILDVYDSKIYQRTELTLLLEKDFILSWGGLLFPPSSSSNPEDESIEEAEKKMVLRNRFLYLLHQNVPFSLFTRLRYIIGTQDWSHFKTPYNWLSLGLEFILISSGAIFSDSQFILDIGKCEEYSSLSHPSLRDLLYVNDENSQKIIAFCICLLRSDDTNFSYSIFTFMFPKFLKSIIEQGSSSDMRDLQKDLETCLKSPVHDIYIDSFPNVMQALIECIAKVSFEIPNTKLSLPSSLIKYCGKGWNAWHGSIIYLETLAEKDAEALLSDWRHYSESDSNTGPPMVPKDCLAECYEAIGELDYYYGYLRRQAIFSETNIALSLEQQGLYEASQYMYEWVQNRARLHQLLPIISPSLYIPGGSGGSKPEKRSRNRRNPLPEFHLWETRWAENAKKLQQWDILLELAKVNHEVDQSLESSWRLLDWNSKQDQAALKSATDLVNQNPSPKRKIFQAFFMLNQSSKPAPGELIKCIEEGVQYTLKEWIHLPIRPTTSVHSQLLYYFQQFLEIQEAQPIYALASNISNPTLGSHIPVAGLGISTTPVNNMSSGAYSHASAIATAIRGGPFIGEVKNILNTWRERLLNTWDDINLWSELVAFRQQVFSTLNLVFQVSNTTSSESNTTGVPTTPFIDSSAPSTIPASTTSQNLNLSGSNTTTNQSNAFAYRGYHETAWIINRFAHVLRKYGLSDVCIQLLNKIYTLPNIEIQDAFAKLKEQAKCYLIHFNVPGSSSSLGRYEDLMDGCIEELHSPMMKPSPTMVSSLGTSELTSGLEIINATNLGYFNSAQKAEFFTLKARFFSRLGLLEEANKVHAQSVQLDMHHGKAWAAWGQYNERRFKLVLHERVFSSSSSSQKESSHPPVQKELSSTQESKSHEGQENSTNISVGTIIEEGQITTNDPVIVWGVHAIHSYLQACTLLPKNSISKCRQILAKVLWIFNFEDKEGSLYKAFDFYQNELPIWHWTLFIPQLLTALSKKEAKQARSLLIRIARHYPQAMYYQLKASNDDCKPILSNLASSNIAMSHAIGEDESNKMSIDSPEKNVSSMMTESQKSQSEAEEQELVTIKETSMEIEGNVENTTENQKIKKSEECDSNEASDQKNSPRTFPVPPLRTHVWEHLEDVLCVLKTLYPLLYITIENVSEQIIARLKPTPDEDLYRIIAATLDDCYQQNWTHSSPNSACDVIEESLSKISEILASPQHPSHSYKTQFDIEFIQGKPGLQEIMNVLHRWRTRLEKRIRVQFRSGTLDVYSRYLMEYPYYKYDDIEVPGQYFHSILSPLPKDSNNDFVKIEHFESSVKMIHKHGAYYHRISIKGSDGRIYPFIVQNPCSRYSRKEEKVCQMFQLINPTLARRKETKNRDLLLSVPNIIPLSAHVRLIVDENDIISFEDILQDHISSLNQLTFQSQRLYSDELNVDDLVLAYRKSICEDMQAYQHQQDSGATSLKLELFEKINKNIVPQNVLSYYIYRKANSWTDYWSLRKRFTLEYAAQTLMVYILAISSRYPSKFFLHLGSGKTLMSDLLPTLNPSGFLTLKEIVPFRLTPNLQQFMGEIGIEGVFAPSLFAIAKALTEDGFELEDYLNLFFKDELVFWNARTQISSSNFTYDRYHQYHEDASYQLYAAYCPSILSSSTQDTTDLSDDKFIAKALMNVDLVYKRTLTLACLRERCILSPENLVKWLATSDQGSGGSSIPNMENGLPVIHQSVIDILNTATSPQKLSLMEPHWHPWF